MSDAASKFDAALYALLRVAQQHAAKGPPHSTQWASVARSIREARSAVRRMMKKADQERTA